MKKRDIKFLLTIVVVISNIAICQNELLGIWHGEEQFINSSHLKKGQGLYLKIFKTHKGQFIERGTVIEVISLEKESNSNYENTHTSQLRWIYTPKETSELINPKFGDSYYYTSTNESREEMRVYSVVYISINSSNAILSQGNVFIKHKLPEKMN